MANITAADVKKLRDATGAGMMDCKKALEEADGDLDKAVELLRIKGETKVKERGAERTATNGLVAAADGAMIQLNCETDFVAKNEQFQQLAADIVVPRRQDRHRRRRRRCSARRWPTAAPSPRTSTRSAAVIGEKLELPPSSSSAPRAARSRRTCTSRRRTCPPQVGVLVEFEGDDLEAARGAAMQVAAMRPQYVTRDEVPADVVENERRIAEATAREEGKPEQALPKIVEGRVNGFFKDVVLLEQPSVQDSKKTRQGRPRRGRRHRQALRPLRGRRRLTGADWQTDRRHAPGAAHRRRGGRDRAGTHGGHRHGRGLVAVRGATEPHRYRRVLLKLSGEVFGGGKLGVDPDVVAGLARQIADVVRDRRAGRHRRRRRQLLPRRRAVRSAAWTGPAPTTWACSAR